MADTGKTYKVGKISAAGGSLPDVVIDFGKQANGSTFPITSEQMTQLLETKPPIVQVEIDGVQGVDGVIMNLYRFERIGDAVYYSNTLYFSFLKFYVMLFAQGTEAGVLYTEEPYYPLPVGPADAGKINVVNQQGDGFELKLLSSSMIANALGLTGDQLAALVAVAKNIQTMPDGSVAFSTKVTAPSFNDAD